MALRRSGEPHHRPDHLKETNVLLTQRCPPARGDDDRAMLARQPHQHRRVHLPKAVFAVLSEDVGDVLAGLLLDLGVCINIARVEARRECMTDRTLARPHEPNQDNIHQMKSSVSSCYRRGSLLAWPVMLCAQKLPVRQYSLKGRASLKSDGYKWNFSSPGR